MVICIPVSGYFILKYSVDNTLNPCLTFINSVLVLYDIIKIELVLMSIINLRHITISCYFESAFAMLKTYLNEEKWTLRS